MTINIQEHIEYTNEKLWENIKNKFNNRKCNGVDINNCLKTSGLKLQNFDRAKLIGSGSYSTVFILKNIDSSSEYAVKCIVTGYSDNYSYSDYSEDIIYSIYCSNINTGPQVYDYFYYRGEREIIEPYMEILFHKMNIKPKSQFINIQIIVMQAYQENCEKFIEHETHAHRTEVIHQMCELLDKIITHNIYYSDISLQNFVVNLTPNNKVDVRIIDFDKKFCTNLKHKIFKNTKHVKNFDTELYGNTNLTYIHIFRLMSLIQLYLICLSMYGMNNKWLYDGFFRTSLSIFLEMNYWKQIITDITQISYTNTSIKEDTIKIESTYIISISSNINNYDTITEEDTSDILVETVLQKLETLRSHLYQLKYPSPFTPIVPIIHPNIKINKPIIHQNIKINDPQPIIHENVDNSKYSRYRLLNISLVGLGLFALYGAYINSRNSRNSKNSKNSKNSGNSKNSKNSKKSRNSRNSRNSKQ